ncbi:MAG: FecR domain-containing protein [Opitutaceae bacterium]|nr:FecR domain-containing protein [Opitutaceae bacterium]
MRFITLFATFGLAMLMTLSLPAQTVRVIFTSGQASMHRPDEAAPRPVVKGETIIIGTRIITGPDGRVVITPMPGVKSIIAPNTTLVLESVSETRTSVSETTQSAILDLKEGSITSDLEKPEGVTYDYSIRTARGLAGARGTTFTVGINRAGIQTIIVSHGSITLNFTDGRTAVLSLGQLSVTQAAGDTQDVNSVGELPETDQQAAQTFIETTITTIAEAVSAGIELDTSTLTDALDTAKSLGVTLPPELQSTVDEVLKTTTTETSPEMTTEPGTEPAADTTVETTIDSTTTGSSTAPDVTTIVTETVAPAGPLATFRARLSATQLSVFDALPVFIKNQLVTLNDAAITTVALSVDSETGLPHTHEDLRIHLAAFIDTPPEIRAFLKKLDPSLDNVPDPASWSKAAFTRSFASWNALTLAEQNTITNLGAGETIMNVSASYLSALLASLDASQRSYILQAGWGDHLAALAGKPTNVSVFNTFAALNSTQRATVKFFELDPGTFYNPNITAAVQALANAADQSTLRQLRIADHLFDNSTIAGDPFTFFSSKLTATLSFYNLLTADQQTVVRALGLGSLLYDYAPAQLIGGSAVTAQQRIADITQVYLDNPTLQQAMRDAEIFAENNFVESGDPINIPDLVSTLTTYINLPERTRTYLRTQDKTYDFYTLANHDGSSPYRTLSDINAFLDGLSAEQFGTLQDLGLSRALIEINSLGTSTLLDLRNVLTYFEQLPDAGKFVLSELGIIDGENIALVGADTQGLNRLLTAYANLPGTLRGSTERLDEQSAGGIAAVNTYGNLANPATPVDRSFFFPRGTDPTQKIQKIAFQSTGDLHVGATRYLRIDNSTAGPTTTFTTGAGHDLHLYAADRIDLNSTAFAATIANIRMSAATINLANLTFPDGSNVELRSKLGVANFGSSAFGKVNFISNVSYGPVVITNQTILNTIPQIQIGTLTP